MANQPTAAPAALVKFLGSNLALVLLDVSWNRNDRVISVKGVGHLNERDHHVTRRSVSGSYRSVYIYEDDMVDTGRLASPEDLPEAVFGNKGELTVSDENRGGAIIARLTNVMFHSPNGRVGEDTDVEGGGSFVAEELITGTRA